MNIYKKALQRKNRKRYFLAWFIPSTCIFTGLAFPMISYWSLLVGPFISLLANREYAMAAIMNDDEVEQELKLINETN